MATITADNDTRISSTDLGSGQLKAARLLCAVAVPAFGAFAGVATAGQVRSVGATTFVDADNVVIADWRAGEIDALHLAPAASATPKPFNLKNVSTPIAPALRTLPEELRFEDMAFHPGAEPAYITVSVTGAPASQGRRWFRSMRQTGCLSSIVLIPMTITSKPLNTEMTLDDTLVVSEEKGIVDDYG